MRQTFRLLLAFVLLGALPVMAARPYKPYDSNYEEDDEIQWEAESKVGNTPIFRFTHYQGTNKYDSRGLTWTFRWGRDANAQSMGTVTGTVWTGDNAVVDYPFNTNTFGYEFDDWYACEVMSTNVEVHEFSRGSLTIKPSPGVDASGAFATLTYAINGSLYGPFTGNFSNWPFALTNEGQNIASADVVAGTNFSESVASNHLTIIFPTNVSFFNGWNTIGGTNGIGSVLAISDNAQIQSITNLAGLAGRASDFIIAGVVTSPSGTSAGGDVTLQGYNQASLSHQAGQINLRGGTANNNIGSGGDVRVYPGNNASPSGTDGVFEVYLAQSIFGTNEQGESARFYGNVDMTDHSITNIATNSLEFADGREVYRWLSDVGETGALLQVTADANVTTNAAQQSDIDSLIGGTLWLASNNAASTGTTQTFDRVYSSNAYRLAVNGYADNEYTTHGDLLDHLTELQGETLFGATNQHPVLTNASLWDALPGATWTQTFALAVGTNVLGQWYYTNAISEFVPVGTYELNYWAQKTGVGNPAVTALVNVISSDGAITNSLATSAESTLDTAVQQQRVSAHVLSISTNHGTFYLGVELLAIRRGGANANLVLYGGSTSRDSYMSTPALEPTETAWGSISGTLTNQTDLTAVFEAHAVTSAAQQVTLEAVVTTQAAIQVAIATETSTLANVSSRGQDFDSAIPTNATYYVSSGGTNVEFWFQGTVNTTNSVYFRYSGSTNEYHFLTPYD
jgi:hypothetical protein